MTLYSQKAEAGWIIHTEKTFHFHKKLMVSYSIF